MANTVKATWVVTLSGDRPIQAVADELKAAGLEVRDVLEFVGTVVGYGSTEVAAKARAISGVADVSPDHEVHVGPPAPIS